MTIFKRLSRVEWDLSTAKVSIISSFHVGEMIQNIYVSCMHENTTPDMENFSYWNVWFIWHEIILSANCSNNYICRLLEPWKKERRGWKVDADQASNEILRVAFCTFFDSCELSECCCEKGKVWTQVDRKLFSLFYFCCYLSILLCWCESNGEVGEAN